MIALSPRTEIVWLDEHGHGKGQQEIEARNVLALFPGIYNTYVDGLERFGDGVVVYAPETRQTAGFIPLGGIDNGHAMLELLGRLKEKTPDRNHVPVVFMYTCGHVSGYVVTASFAWNTGEPDMAEITCQMYAELVKAKPPRFVGEEPAVPEPWDFDL